MAGMGERGALGCPGARRPRAGLAEAARGRLVAMEADRGSRGKPCLLGSWGPAQRVGGTGRGGKGGRDAV